MSRKLPNWLQGLAEYVEDTESPRSFWAWAGIFCISSALQRKVWLPFGMDNLYPNLYIMLVAPPGKLRKGAPLGFSRRILRDAHIPTFADSPTKRALTKYMHKLSETERFKWKDEEGKTHIQSHCSVALVSKELSSFLAIEPAKMIEILTDLFDSHDTWEYETSEKGRDRLFGVCINCFFATTPIWISKNLPEEAIGGGFASRFVTVTAEEKYKSVPIPKIPDQELYRKLLHDLVQINKLSGPIRWEEKALAHYENWYGSLDGLAKKSLDEHLSVFIERMHIIAIKVAIALHAASKDTLVIEYEDIRKAINLVMEIHDNLMRAFSAHGRSNLALDMDRILMQISVRGEKGIKFSELLAVNYRNVTKLELQEILENLMTMGKIVCESKPTKKGFLIRYFPAHIRAKP